MGAPKSRHGRRDVPLDFALVKALREHRTTSEWPADDDLAFSAGNGSAIMPGNLRRRVLKPAAEESDVSWAGFHTFRHTCASLLFAEGRNAVQVQRWLGHHSAAFTLATYVHLMDGDVGAPLSVVSLGAETADTCMRTSPHSPPLASTTIDATDVSDRRESLAHRLAGTLIRKAPDVRAFDAAWPPASTVP
jgi:hypothetical protein